MTAFAPKPFPWAEAMRFGFGVLRLAPREFWAMTPRELAHAIVAVRGVAAAPLDRATLDALLRRFPDRVDASGERA
ncbi:putative phage protein (TIGR02216 family) [Rhodopseudomonas rhenobacensis]|uniref:Putative phage protein (TIGR02216 family) n=1 Tax=Rhodopseudomonas rhenobacensis TaxID=87461 RepID=A0A7W8DZ51_9BRAD|nr:rcc01693 family protein [Rhodopseudomonas rhenobacensis]MBB5046536.1 putative phage protein (TIGR02216 family) [Rhodopseudomonas rhenobacensis]